MTVQMVLLPVFVQVALTFAMLFWMASARTRAASRAARPRSATSRSASPRGPRGRSRSATTTTASSRFRCCSTWWSSSRCITRTADLIFVVLSWLFVLSRIVHAYMHTTSNHVPTRFNVFAVGVFVLLAMWIYFALRFLIHRMTPVRAPVRRHRGSRRYRDAAPPGRADAEGLGHRASLRRLRRSRRDRRARLRRAAPPRLVRVDHGRRYAARRAARHAGARAPA